jgi:DNA gyrase subunit A
MARIADLVKEEKLKGILEIDDIYGLDSKGIQITVKKNVNKEELVEKLYQMTPLESSFSCNQNIVVNGFPKVLGFKEIIHEWVLFRVNAIKRGLQFDVDKKAHKKRMLEALKQVLLDVDKAVSIIRNTPTNKEVVANLQQAFSIDEEQAEFVAEIKLRHLNKEYLINRVDEIATLEEEIKDLTDLIGSKVRLAKLIISQLQEVKAKHGQERKSQVIQPSTISVSTEPEIEDYNVKVFVTREGYLKKITLTSLRSANEIKVKDGDELVGEFETTNNSDILVFTNKQNVYKYKSYELENHKPSVLGEYLPSLLGLEDEEIEFVTVTNDYKGHLLIGFEDGKFAKIELSAYYTKQNRKKLANAYANKKAVYWNVVNEGDNVEVLAISSIDKALIFNTSTINPKSSKTTIGVQTMKSKNDSYVKSYFTIDKDYEEADYYRTAGAGIGKYLRDGDFSELIIDKQ